MTASSLKTVIPASIGPYYAQIVAEGDPVTVVQLATELYARNATTALYATLNWVSTTCRRRDMELINLRDSRSITLF